jgi:hypothetical protein
MVTMRFHIHLKLLTTGTARVPELLNDIESVKQFVEQQLDQSQSIIMAFDTDMFMEVDLKKFEATYKALVKSIDLSAISIAVIWLYDPDSPYEPMIQFFGTDVEFSSTSDKHKKLFFSLNHLQGNLKRKYWDGWDALEAAKLIPKQPWPHSYFDSDILEMLRRCDLATDESPV